MISAFRAAWTMLRRPTLIAPALIAVVASTAMAVALAFTAALGSGASALPGAPGLEDPAASNTLSRIMGQPFTALGLIVLAISVLHVAGQYSSGMIRLMLVRQPNRTIWLAGNWLALATLAILLSLLAAVVAGAVGLICALIWRVDASAWVNGIGDALAGAGNLALGTVAFALAGSALAVWLRSATGALTVALVYAVFETLVSASTPVGRGLLPASAFTTVATSGHNGNVYLPSLLAAAVILAVVLIGTTGLVSTRDVTD